ncbi:MAG: hypothetical protein KGZ63_11300 [Clostridiales bacterium]|jgi:hypothetical protein|nr:hypothetical protein [Clostridiales bacterium]
MQANGGVAQQVARLQKELRQKDQNLKKVAQQLRRKESAFSRNSSVIGTKKKGKCDLGGRGRLTCILGISTES